MTTTPVIPCPKLDCAWHAKFSENIMDDASALADHLYAQHGELSAESMNMMWHHLKTA